MELLGVEMPEGVAAFYQEVAQQLAAEGITLGCERNDGPQFGGFFGLISFLFAILWLSWMGRDYEEIHGAPRLFGLYVMGALAGAALGLGAAAAVPGVFGHAWAGAWGGVAAVLCATAVVHPEKSIHLMFLGVVPVRWLAIGFVVLDLAFVRDWGFRLDRLQTPVTIWQGALDLMVPFAHGKWLAANVAGARARLLPDEGHISLVGRVDEVVDDLLERAGP